MFSTKTPAGLCFSLVILLGACAQQVEPPRITPQPIYNKHGDIVGCEGGGQYNSQQEYPCDVPPEGGCEEIPGSNYPCTPPPQRGCDDHQGSNYPCEPWRADDNPQDTSTPNDDVPTTGPIN